MYMCLEQHRHAKDQLIFLHRLHGLTFIDQSMTLLVWLASVVLLSVNLELLSFPVPDFHRPDCSCISLPKLNRSIAHVFPFDKVSDDTTYI